MKVTLGEEINRGQVRRRPGQGAAALTLRGLGPGARVMTSFGELPAEALRRRDLLRTRSGEFRAVEWIDRIRLDADFLKRHPGARPIVIRAGSLGSRLPVADLVLAPHQPLSQSQPVSGAAIEAGCESDAPLGCDGWITYTVFHCGSPASVLSEGVWLDVGP